jgi:hypothetical protein
VRGAFATALARVVSGAERVLGKMSGKAAYLVRTS